MPPGHDAPRWGVIVPSTNTEVERDLIDLRPRGVTTHVARMHLPVPDLRDDDAFVRVLELLRVRAREAAEVIATVRPELVIFATTAETFWGGPQGNADFTRDLERLAGVPVITGATAIEQDLARLGARRVAVLTPYQPVMDEQVIAYLQAIGIEITAITGLRSPDAYAIAEIPAQVLADAAAELVTPRADALLALGTNLPIQALIPELEASLGVPVIGVNASLVRAAVRCSGR